jgi:2-oxoacid:acceptor oxidoreductase gamma subunit (pyruvate/2-ketoisovalerate family)
MKRKCIEVRWHGRGGQGAVTAAMILAEAAYMDGYKGVTAAPFFGAERRGAPVLASNRFGREAIKTFSLVESPDVVVVLDETLLRVVNVAAGVRPDGIVIINTAKPPEAFEVGASINIATTNASDCAREAGLIVSGSVIFNTAILGGFSKATGLVGMESIEKALRSHFRGQAADKNVRVAWLAYEGTLNLGECQLACA